MTRTGFAIALIVLMASLPVWGLNEGHAQARTQNVSHEPTFWDHNGSVMYLVENGASLELYYQKPRPGMLDAGAHSGSLLFRGEINNGQYLGTAYIFNPNCGPIPFEVKGPILDDQRIVLTGEVPRVGQNCRTFGSHTSNLEFRRIKTNDAAQSQESTGAQPSPIAFSKPEVPSSSTGESAAAAQPSVKNEAPVAKDSSASVTDPKATSIPADQASVTTETAGTKDLHNYLWGVAFIVMTVWLLIVLFGRTLLRRMGDLS
jgi:hypothetical protein